VHASQLAGHADRIASSEQTPKNGGPATRLRQMAGSGPWNGQIGVGNDVGTAVGAGVGLDVVGDEVGAVVGETVGEVVGDVVGLVVGEVVGEFVGASVGAFVGIAVGDDVHVPQCALQVVRRSTPLLQPPKVAINDGHEPGSAGDPGHGPDGVGNDVGASVCDATARSHARPCTRVAADVRQQKTCTRGGQIKNMQVISMASGVATWHQRTHAAESQLNFRFRLFSEA
jgi:hypothetical protein